MAEKYWVGGSGTWDNSTTTNWSNSNGGAGGASVPTSTDNANFTTSSGNGTVTIASTAACANLVVNWTAVKTNIFSLSGNFSPAGNITINGNSTINRILVQSSTVGTQRTITNLGTVACTNVDFMDIKFNTAVDFSGQTDIGNANGNSGITFPASVAQTWSGTSGGNWSTNAWTTRVPLPQDDVSLGVAFSASQTVTADMPRLGRSISWTGATGTPTWAFNTANTIFGSLTLINSMALSGSNTPTFSGRSNYYLTFAGKTTPWAGNIKCPGGSYTLLDAWTSTGSNWYHSYGGFYANGMNMTAGIFNFGSDGNTVRTLDLGSGTWTTTATTASTVWSMTSLTNLTYIASSPTIVISGASSNTRTFAGLGLTYGTLTYTVAGSTGGLDITGSNSFAQINFSDASNARTLRFTAGTTTTIRNGNGFNVQGTSGKLMTVSSITGATHTLSSTSRQVCSYLNVSYSIASAGLFYAQTTSTDGGNNTGWIFTNAPALSIGGGSNGIQNRMNLQNLRSLI